MVICLWGPLWTHVVPSQGRGIYLVQIPGVSAFCRGPCSAQWFARHPYCLFVHTGVCDVQLYAGPEGRLVFAFLFFLSFFISFQAKTRDVAVVLLYVYTKYIFVSTSRPVSYASLFPEAEHANCIKIWCHERKLFTPRSEGQKQLISVLPFMQCIKKNTTPQWVHDRAPRVQSKKDTHAPMPHTTVYRAWGLTPHF